jgi:TatA/E family protein of Tat protein translocase
MGIGNIGWTEFVVILALALIFFGPRRLPTIAQSLGKAMREFQKALNEVKREVAQADRQAAQAKSYVKSILPPPPSLDDIPAGPPPIPEDAEPEVTREAPEAAEAAAAEQAEPDEPTPTAAPRETEVEDGDPTDKDVS